MHIRRKRVKGQTMQVVALLFGLGVLIGLVAIAFDGGSALLQRRTMQNSADSATLAGIKIMGQNVVGTCDPAPCHPAYLVRNDDVLDMVQSFASANRGGTTGTAVYTVPVEYHYNYLGGPSQCAGGAATCYQPAPARDPSQFVPVPAFVDGLRVTTVVTNPTTFAKAIPNPIQQLQVKARSAARLFPTCPPEPTGQDAPLPFTRFRPALEHEIQIFGNDLCHPFPFWTSHGDTAQGNFKNVVSFNQNTMYQSEFGANTAALIQQPDTRNGVSGGLGNYHHNQGGGGPPFDNCGPTYPQTQCADMRGSGSIGGSQASQDIANWIFWRWAGQISLTQVFTGNYETYYQSIPSTNWGRQNSTPRAGDWVETYTGNTGQNVQEPLHDSAGWFGSVTPLSGAPLNWGKAITNTVYLWGDATLPSDRSSQTLITYNPPCGQQPCPPVEYHWQDTLMSGSYGGCGNPPCYVSADPVQRVRFTKAITFVFYENLQGNYGAVGPNCSLPGSGSSAWGVLPSEYLPGPNPGAGCGWEPGNGTYSGQVDPDGP
jgi:hypothetical protein